MQPQPSNKKLFLIAGSTVVLAIILVLTLSLEHKKPTTKPGSGQGTTYTDPVSHETIVTQKGKAPETNGNTTATTTPLFAGFDKLINQGITIQQLNALEQAFTNYQPFAHSSAQISLAVDDIQPVSPSTSGDAQERWSIKSHIVVNQKDTYQFQFYYSGVGGIQLHLYNAAGNSELFDSGVIDTSTADGQSSPDS